MARTYELTFTAPDRWLSANDSKGGRYGLAAVKKEWRKSTVIYARKFGLPRGLARVRIDARLFFPSNRHRDEANYHATLKPIIDGLGPDRSYIKANGRKVFAPGWGLIADDTPAHLVGPFITIAPGWVPAPGYIVLTITDLSGEVALVARIRTIKPEFFTSLTIAELPLRARLTFIGLWTHVDDEGRCIADARLIKAAVWPLDDITREDVARDLGALTESSLITQYEAGNRRYLAVRGWDEHQRINRATPSRFPAPDSPDSTVVAADGTPVTSQDTDSSTTHTQLTESSSTTHDRKGKERNREQGTGKGKEGAASHAMLDGLDDDESTSSKRVELGSDADPDFAKFWRVYPRKDAKEGARKAWRAAAKKADPSDIAAGAERYRDDPNRKPEFTKLPTTWLNQGCWNDSPIPGPARVGAAAPVSRDFSDWNADE